MNDVVLLIIMALSYYGWYRLISLAGKPKAEEDCVKYSPLYEED